jgi:hypothetical protein
MFTRVVKLRASVRSARSSRLLQVQWHGLRPASASHVTKMGALMLTRRRRPHAGRPSSRSAGDSREDMCHHALTHGRARPRLTGRMQQPVGGAAKWEDTQPSVPQPCKQRTSSQRRPGDFPAFESPVTRADMLDP